MTLKNEKDLKFTDFFKLGEGFFKHLSESEFSELIDESTSIIIKSQKLYFYNYHNKSKRCVLLIK